MSYQAKALNFVACLTVMLSVSCKEKQTQHFKKNAIISTTLCADGYLHSLPELEPQLAALSWQSRSELSQTPQHLRHLPQTTNDPESLLKWKNAISISSAGDEAQINIKWGEDFQTVWDNFALLASELGTDDPSEQFQTRLGAIQKPDLAPRVLYLDRSGASAGPGTFVHNVIEAAGAENIIQNFGWQSPDTETLIGLYPDIILTSFMDSNYAGANDRTSRHSALAEKIASLPVIDIPGRLWPCAGPGLVEAAEQLSKEMSML